MAKFGKTEIGLAFGVLAGMYIANRYVRPVIKAV